MKFEKHIVVISCVYYDISNHQQLNFLFNNLYRLKTKRISMFHDINLPGESTASQFLLTNTQ